MILHPLGVKKSQNWARKSAESDGYDQTTDIRTKWALPRDDTCAPDLYIPLMSFVTYVLLYGLYTGISRPEENAKRGEKRQFNTYNTYNSLSPGTCSTLIDAAAPIF